MATDDYPQRCKYIGEADGMGVDVARQGEDKTIFAIGNERRRICELREFFHADTMETSGNVRGILRAFPGITPVVDTDGLGAGVSTDRVREMGFDVVAFHSGEKSDAVDRSGELGFANKKAEAWWNMRELLDPAYESEVELPPDDQLLGDLTAPKWKVEVQRSHPHREEGRGQEAPGPFPRQGRRRRHVLLGAGRARRGLHGKHGCP